MATSSERSPPPFPDSEDQELETEEPNASAQDSDEGEDIFLGSDNPLEAKMDPAVPENELTEPSSGPIQEQASGIFSDPLTKHVSQTENVVSDQSANKMINELTDAVEVIKDMTGEVSGGADIFETPDERADMAEVTKDTTEEPGGNTEAAGDISESFGDVSKKLNETTDPAELTKDETEQPTDNAEAASNIADVSEDIFEMPDEPTDVVEVELKKEELSLSVGAEAVRNTAELPQNINEGPVDIAEPLTGNSESAICTDYEQQIVIDKAVNEALSAPILDIFSDSVSDTEQPPKTGVIDPLSDHLMDVPVAEITAPVTNATSQSPRDLFDDEPSDLFAEPLLKNSGKKDVLPRDLTEEDEHSYLFTEPLAKNPVKQETNIFNEPDEDLFKDPIGGTSNKSLNVTFGEAPVEKPADAKAGGVSGPLSDGFMDDPADIFAEEGLVSLPPRVTSTANPKTNGVHSDEESDIFAEATVELSLDSPRNDRKNKETVVPSVSALSVSATASLPKPQTATPEELEEEESGDNFEINISITNPEKVGDGMNAYMGYKVSTQTTLPMFRSKTFTVRRRFSDFLGLYEKLCEKHASNGFIVPPPPEKSILGMTKVKVGKEDPSSAEFVERRRAALERYLQRVVCHPSLLQDPDVREFLEREELPRALSTQALSGAGFLKMISKATDAVSKMTIKMNESDVWFEEKLQEVEGEDQQLRKLHAMVDSLVNHRKELSVNTAGFAKSVAMLGSSEDNTALSRALSQLAEVEDKMEQLHQDQASNDSFTLAEMLADYIRLLGSVRASFDQRMRAWQRWQDAQNMLQKKRETEAKLLWANKPDKLQQAKEDIAEWEAKVTQYERDFDRVSATVRKEVLRFEKEKARDFKRLVVKYLEALLLSQQQLIKYWEAFLPEAKAIA